MEYESGSCEGEYCEYYANYDVESHSASYGVNTEFVDKYLVTPEATMKMKRKIEEAFGPSADSRGSESDAPVEPSVGSKRTTREENYLVQLLTEHHK